MATRKKKGGGFMKIYRSLAYSGIITPVDKLIWGLIADKCEMSEHFNGEKWAEISISELAKCAGVARTTALRALNRLCAVGLIERQQSLINGYADKYSIPEQDVVDAIVASVEKYGYS